MRAIPTPNRIDVTIGSILQHIRRSTSVTRQTLADHVGISPQQLQKYEVGANRISMSRFFDICAALGIKPSDLLVKVESEIDEIPGENGVMGRRNAKALAAKTETLNSLRLASIENKDLKRALLDLLRAIEDNGQDRQKADASHGF